MSVPEPEWSPEDVARLVASRQVERGMGSHGIPMSEALDPKNQFAFEGQELPTVDWAEKQQLDQADAYYKKWDKKDAPVNRNGHRWGVTFR